MKVTLIALVAVATLTFGCSKKTASAPEAAEAGAPVAAAVESNPMIAAGLEDLTLKVQQQQYEAAVGSLVGLAHMPKSDKDQAIFDARLRQTQDALLKKAQAGDQSAQQSVQMLGRMMTGR